MDFVLDGVLLCRQAECIVAHWVEHIVALHTLHTGIHIAADISARMTDVQPRAGRVREHIQNIPFLFLSGW